MQCERKVVVSVCVSGQGKLLGCADNHNTVRATVCAMCAKRGGGEGGVVACSRDEGDGLLTSSP